MSAENESKVIGSRIPIAQVRQIESIAAELSKRAKGAPVSVAMVVSILVDRALPGMLEELELNPAT